MTVDEIKNGIVIDHITAGKGMQIYNLLGLDNLECSIALIKNAPSRKMGKKDILKIDGMFDVDYDLLGYVDSNITVNIVEDGKMVKKLHMELPEHLKNVAKCKNPRCITSIEQEIVHEFKLVNKEKKIYRCVYCDAEHKVK